MVRYVKYANYLFLLIMITTIFFVVKIYRYDLARLYVLEIGCDTQKLLFWGHSLTGCKALATNQGTYFSVPTWVDLVAKSAATRNS